MPIIKQDFERRARAVAEHVDRALQGIGPQRSAAHRGKAINALAEIDRLDRQKDAGLRGQLQHQRLSKKVCTTTAKGGWGSW
ncbi:hypothetical protein [Candidatus Entotheonella palauensis]|uniref:hypothetical protein n=1 Tax=Candidatus Entotheonella palauensis TaxID=93172 RepID=UPI002119B6B5|nr:hypothetical protein [Candidatus Entotheonella palauensis]